MNHYMTNCVYLVLFVSIAARGQTMEWDRAWGFRETVGLGPMDLAAAAVSASVQEGLVAVVRDDLGARPEADRAAVDATGDASHQVSEVLSWGRDPADAWANHDDAQAGMLEILAPLIDEIQDSLPSDLRGYVDRAIDNLGLDTPYRLLELTRAQREAILLLQRERDAVLRDARQRHRPARLEVARETFRTQVQSLLTPIQHTELAQFEANIAANLDAVWDRELADYPDTDDSTDRAAKNSGPSGRQIAEYLAAKARPALARWLGNLKVRVEARRAIDGAHEVPNLARPAPAGEVGIRKEVFGKLVLIPFP